DLLRVELAAVDRLGDAGMEAGAARGLDAGEPIEQPPALVRVIRAAEKRDQEPLELEVRLRKARGDGCGDAGRRRIPRRLHVANQTRELGAIERVDGARRLIRL